MTLLEIIRTYAWAEDDTCIIHRGPGNHVEAECWCYPLELTVEQIKGIRKSELKQLLEQHLRIH